MTAKVLRGANDAKVKQFGFQQLSTYGVMKAYKEKRNREPDQRFGGGWFFLQLSESKFPVLSLSQRAAEVLKGNESVYHRRIAVSETREPADGLFEALRTLRKKAGRQGADTAFCGISR